MKLVRDGPALWTQREMLRKQTTFTSFGAYDTAVSIRTLNQ